MTRPSLFGYLAIGAIAASFGCVLGADHWRDGALHEWFLAWSWLSGCATLGMALAWLAAVPWRDDP